MGVVTDRTAAFHEAGHAITAHHLELAIGWVSLSGCQLRLNWTESFDDFLTAAMAGGVAAHLHGRQVGKTPSAGDVELIWQYRHLLPDPLGDLMTADLWPARFELASDRAAVILKTNWRGVECLARELSYQGYLTGSQAVKIIQSSTLTA